MRAILDTNVIMSGIFWAGDSRKILILLEEKQFEHICSREIAQEYIDTATKLKKKIKNIEESLIEELIDMILLNSTFCESIKGSGPKCRDINDQMFLDLAVSMETNYIVSGDKDLLEISNYSGGEVIKPHSFLRLF